MKFLTFLRSAREETAALEAPDGVAVREYATANELRVDRDAAVIHGVKILGLESKNGRRYRPAALQAALEQYEGVKVNLNHAEKVSSPRNYADRLGVLKAVEMREDGLYGDLHYNPKHAVAEQLTWDAEHNPAAVGLSPAHFIRVKKERGVEIAEAIVKVVSVDLVGDPATTKGLFESVETPAVPSLEDEPPTIESVERLEQHYGDLIAAVREETAASVRINVVAAVKALMASTLPYNAWDSGLLDAIVVAESVEAREQIISERCDLAKRLAGKPHPPQPSRPISPPRQTMTPMDAKTFAKAIR